jgi:hypothetical protein
MSVELSRGICGIKYAMVRGKNQKVFRQETTPEPMGGRKKD